MNESRNGRQYRDPNTMEEHRASWRPSDRSMGEDRYRTDDRDAGRERGYGDRWDSQRGRGQEDQSRWMERDREFRHEGSGQRGYGYSREQGMGHHQSFGDRSYERDDDRDRQQYRHSGGDNRWGQDRSFGRYDEDRPIGEDRGMGSGTSQGYGGSRMQSSRFDDQGYSQRMFGGQSGSERTTGGWYGGGGGMMNDDRRSGGSFQGAGHRGKGPKNFTRSDERIKERVSEALQDDDDIDASEIEVEVRSGEVILKGTVEDRRMKRLAEECAERLPGVTDVQNQLKVGGNKWQLSSRGNQSGSGGVGTSESDRSKNRA